MGPLRPARPPKSRIKASVLFDDLFGETMDCITWEPKSLCNLFDVDFEATQLNSIAKDLDLKSMEVCSIMGGAMVRTFMKEDIFRGDIDIFPHDETSLNTLVREFGKQSTWTKDKYAYSFEYSAGVRKTKVQVITKREPNSCPNIWKTFDLEHCKLAYSPRNRKMYTTAASPTVVAQRKIVLSHIDDPTYTMMRVLKYKRLGFHADKALEQLATMAVKGIKNVSFDTFKCGEGEIAEAILSASS